VTEQWLILRSGKRLAYDDAPGGPLAACDDMWTHLFDRIIGLRGGEGRIWRRSTEETAASGVYDTGLREFRGPAFDVDREPGEGWRPDLIVNRGGYGVYAEALRRWPSAFRVYYGAGMRYIPRDGLRYDLILVDTLRQEPDVRAAHPRSLVRTIFKPAIDDLFAPRGAAKRYDLVILCDGDKPHKGLDWLLPRIPPGLSVLRIGRPDSSFTKARDEGTLAVTFTGRVPHTEVPALAEQARVGVVCDDGQFDSGPRILPELLALGLPVVVRDTVRLNWDRYRHPEFCIPVNDRTAARMIARTVARAGGLDGREHYLKRIGLGPASRAWAHVIQEAMARHGWRPER